MSGLLSARVTESQPESRHRILARLGQGGTADVYLAVAQGPSGFNKLVVLKVLKASLQEDPEFAQMFQNEARLAARLNHPNIVQTYEAIEENGIPILVMEYLEGEPLSAILRRGKGELPLVVHLKIIAEMLAGLHYAHELRDFDGTRLGVVHRDVTPHNVFVTFEGQIKILDFGIAKLDVSDIETRAGTLKGKVRYMAPEQIRCKPIDRRVDIYSAGVMLWQAATGEALWKNQTEPAIIARILEGKTPSARSVNPNVPAALERICQRAMAHEREERYATAAEMGADLEALILELGGPVHARDAGKLVSRIFADEREAIKSMIEVQLSASMTWTGPQRVSRLSSTGEFGIPRSTRNPIGLERFGLGTGSSSLSGGDFEIQELGPSTDQKITPRRLWLVIGALALVGLVCAAFWGGANDELNTLTESAKPAELAQPKDSASRAPLVGSLTIQAFPSDAKLFLDGEPLDSNPHTRALALDGSTHSLRAEAPGHVSASRSFAMHQSADFSITLEPEPRPEPAPGAPKRRAAALNTGATPAPTPTPDRPATVNKDANCRNPFYLDSSGIKRVLPDCL